MGLYQELIVPLWSSVYTWHTLSLYRSLNFLSSLVSVPRNRKDRDILQVWEHCLLYFQLPWVCYNKSCPCLQKCRKQMLTNNHSSFSSPVSSLLSFLSKADIFLSLHFGDSQSNPINEFMSRQGAAHDSTTSDFSPGKKKFQRPASTKDRLSYWKGEMKNTANKRQYSASKCIKLK